MSHDNPAKDSEPRWGDSENRMIEQTSDKEHPCNATGLEDSWVLADWAIEHACPDIYKKGGGYWGAQCIPNWGILRGAVEAVVRRAQQAPRPSLAASGETPRTDARRSGRDAGSMDKTP